MEGFINVAAWVLMLTGVATWVLGIAVAFFYFLFIRPSEEE
jgi:hypothetical protein